MGCILLVEDDQTLNRLIQEVLEDEGYSVHTTVDTQQALEILATIQVDLVITDLVLPQLDGIDLCRALSANLATAHIPVIICSGRPESLIADQCIYAAFLSKPFDLDQLLQLVALHILPTTDE